MAKASAALSLVELEKLFEARQAEVEVLLRKREDLQSTIEKLDAEIQRFLTTGSSGRAPRPRPKNASSLRDVIREILAKNKKGLTLREITQQAQETGYKSHSQNFSNVVYQCLYNTSEIVHDDATGLYKLKR